MMGKNPLDLTEKKLSKDEIVDAIRIAIIAELDAVNLYLQIARAVDDEKIKKVFEDVAKEEKTHVGEFLALLKNLDREQESEILKGAEEVKELTGIEVKNSKNFNEQNFEDLVKNSFRKTLSEVRVVSKNLPKLVLGRGLEAVPMEFVKEGKIERVILPLCEISVKFKITQKDLDYYIKTGQAMEMPEVYKASLELCINEEKMIIENIKNNAIKISMSPWLEPGQSVADIAKAVSELFKVGARKPFVLFTNPVRFTRLLAVSEKTGLMDLDRVKQLVDVVAVTPVLSDNEALLISATQDVIDLVYGSDAEIDYIGPENGAQVFRAFSTLAVRVKDPRRVVLLQETRWINNNKLE